MGRGKEIYLHIFLSLFTLKEDVQFWYEIKAEDFQRHLTTDIANQNMVERKKKITFRFS